MTNFKGFELFSDIEDKELRNRNRAVTLANISDDHSKNRIINLKGATLILGYFKEVPEEDKDDVKNKFAAQMKERGWILATN